MRPITPALQSLIVAMTLFLFTEEGANVSEGTGAYVNYKYPNMDAARASNGRLSTSDRQSAAVTAGR